MHPAHALILESIRARGPITAAAFMEIALYHPDAGYYATASQRSGRAGDFFTSVDLGSLFGEMLAVQFAEMARLLQEAGTERIDLVEAAAGNGRLMRDVLDAAAAHHPGFYDRIAAVLVERSAAARARQPATLGAHARRAASRADLPQRIAGVLFANELLDAMPVHVVVRRGGALREIHVGERDGTLVEQEGPLSDPRIAEHLERVDASLQEGCRGEVCLAAVDWVQRAAAAIDRGFLLLFDYGHPARRLYSPAHGAGTLMAYQAHVTHGRHWLATPGEADLTAHVDFTSVERAAIEGGLTPLGIVDQTYFLTSLGIAARLEEDGSPASVKRRLAAKTLLMPGGLGSTIKAACFAKGVGRPRLGGLSSGRLT